MAIDPEKIFVELPTDPLMASYDLLQRLERDLAKGKPSDADFSTACGFLEAFYESQNWKPPERLLISS